MALFSFFIGVALKSTVVLGVAWMTALLMGTNSLGCSAAARHLVWTAAAAGVLTLPLLSVSVPALRIQAAGRFLAAPTPATTFQTTVIESSSSTAETSVSNRPMAPLKTSPLRADWKLWLMLLWAAGAAVAFAQMLAA